MSGFTGTMRLIRLALRRDRITLPAWILGMAVFLTATTAMFEDSYGKHPLLLVPDTRIVVENPGMRVLGLVTGPTVGGYTLHRDALTLAVLAALMSVLAVVRHTRQAEELGRSEMLGAGVVGRYASLAAAVIVALAANVVLAVLLGLSMMLAGQPAAGSLVAGASIALVGVAFTGVAAVTSQLASTTRGATGLAGAGLGLSFMLAALGNMLGTVDSAALRVTSAWPVWLSPIGWGQQMRPFADNLWWPLALAVLGTALLFWLAVVLVGRRDVGRGMWPERRGAAHAGPCPAEPGWAGLATAARSPGGLGDRPARLRPGLRGAERPDRRPRGSGDGVVRHLRWRGRPARRLLGLHDADGWDGRGGLRGHAVAPTAPGRGSGHAGAVARHRSLPTSLAGRVRRQRPRGRHDR